MIEQELIKWYIDQYLENYLWSLIMDFADLPLEPLGTPIGDPKL